MNVLTDNITLFARTLQRTGFQLGTGQILESIRAVEAIGIASKEDFRSALFSTLVTRPSERQIFAQAFDVFWQNPELFERALASMLTQTPVPPREIPKTPGARRLADAFRAMHGPKPGQDRKTLELDARATVSTDELLSNKDFEQMTSDEIARARALISRMHWSLPDRMSRRTEAAGSVSSTLTRNSSAASDISRQHWPPVVTPCKVQISPPSIRCGTRPNAPVSERRARKKNGCRSTRNGPKGGLPREVIPRMPWLGHRACQGRTKRCSAGG